MNTHTPTRWRAMKAVTVSVALMMSATGGAYAENWLITPQEAAMNPAAETDPLQGGEHFNIGREALNIGPIIEVEKPQKGVPQQSPVEIVVKFVPRSHPIDIKTLEVELVKFINIDITERVVEYTTEQGIQLEKADVPEGAHRVRIELADTTGALSVQEFLFEVL